tara:strand:- start:559 stop:1578 length:1020 start_codon:yes stop_codon:yes gene_type:complete
MKIIVENSTWNNLGDGFYQFSLTELFKKTFPKADIYFGEGPVQRGFHPNKRQLSNALLVNEYQKADLHVFSGPILMALTKSEYKNTIKNIITSGSKYALISVSCSGLSGKLLDETRDFLKKYPPTIFSSRDPESYEKFKDYVPSAYNGICTAFLVDELLQVDALEMDDKYIISSFYRNPEPLFDSKVSEPEIEDIILKKNNSIIDLLPHKINRHLQIYKNIQSHVGSFKIVRTVQQVSNKSNNFNFKAPNSFITYNPLNFLSAFKGTEFTISERVHACATTLAFGKPAQLLIDNPRNGIFERFGFDWRSNNGIMKPDSNFNIKIKEEMVLLQNYLLQNI